MWVLGLVFIFLVVVLVLVVLGFKGKISLAILKKLRRDPLAFCPCLKRKVKIGKVVMYQADVNEIKNIL